MVEKYKRPVEDITLKVLELIKQEDALVGGITPHHVKWLLMFTYYQFDVRTATLTFDFHKKPRMIYVTPTRNGSHFGIKEWAKLKFMLKWKKVERDLPGYMKLPGFAIEFCRIAPPSSYRIEHT